MKKSNNWYNQIEKPIRELVRLLRNNGFNTVCSCGHKKYIQMEWYIGNNDINQLYNLLCENGYSNFELHLYWPSSGVGRFMELRLLR